MSRRTKIWFAVAATFGIANLAGGIYAAMLAEMSHAGVHFGLTLVGAAWALGVWRRGHSAFAMDAENTTDALPLDAALAEDRLSHLEQTVDAVALEVERIGEGQRFMVRTLTEDKSAVAATERVASAREMKDR